MGGWIVNLDASDALRNAMKMAALEDGTTVKALILDILEVWAGVPHAGEPPAKPGRPIDMLFMDDL